MTLELELLKIVERSAHDSVMIYSSLQDIPNIFS